MGNPMLLPLKFLLIAIDFAITLVTFQWIPAVKKLLSKEPLRSLPVDGVESHRRHPDFHKELLKVPRPGVDTLYKLMMEAISKYGDRNVMGSRTLLGYKSPKVREFSTELTWLTYKDLDEQAHKFGAALRAVGMVAAPTTTDLKEVKTPCRMAIFENTCAPWMIAAIGAFSQSITVTTVYATLGIDAVVEAVNDNKIPVIVCNKKSVQMLIDKLKKMPTLKCIVYTNDNIAPNEDVTFAAPSGLTVKSFDEFVASGDVAKFPPTPPVGDSCAVVMYTSGSTGKPKGVIITHAMVAAACGSGEISVGIRAGQDVYLAYLPLAHIMEIIAEFACLMLGCTLCYADPKSLTTTGSVPVGALEAFQPTLMVAVPKIWDTIRKGILSKVAAGSPVAQFLVETALEWRDFALKNGFDTPLFNALVFKKFKQVVGGRLRKALSGGGPTNPIVQDFIRTAFGIYFIQGYGLTETCAITLVQMDDDLRGNIAGSIVPAVEIKLESTPDVTDKAGQPYLSTDRFDVVGTPIFGRGEIMVRGSSVSLGYYMMEDKTKEAFDADGWFHTGDIGQFMADGSIRIVDRKKNLIKLKGGEYIAIEKMETVYANSYFVDAVKGGVCCYGDGDMDRPVLMMQLSEANTMSWAKANNVAGDFDKIKQSQELYDAIMKDMRSEHANSDLSHLEKIVAVKILDIPFTPENGCLTAANKLQRRNVISVFEKEFLEVKEKGIFN